MQTDIKNILKLLSTALKGKKTDTLHFPHFERGHVIGTLKKMFAKLNKMLLEFRMRFP